MLKSVDLLLIDLIVTTSHYSTTKLMEVVPLRNRVTFAVSTGCSYKVPACVEAATAKFDAYKAGYEDGYTLSPDFKSTILKTAMSRLDNEISAKKCISKSYLCS